MSNTLNRRQLLSQSLSVGGGLALSSGLLSACSKPASSGEKTSDQHASSHSQPAADATPQHGGRIRLGIIDGNQAGTLDAHTAIGGGILRGFALYSKLWEWDENMLPRLALAEFAEPNATASEWTLRVKPGLEFHHGKSITADDLAFSVLRLTDPKLASPFRYLVQWIDRDSVKKLDKHTIRLSFRKDIKGFLALPETWVNFGGIVPTDYDPIKNPVGAGPYKLKSFIPGQRSVFTRFENYFKADKPYADEFEIIDFKDQVSRLTALQAGQIDLANSIPPEYALVLQKDPNSHIVTSKTNIWYSFDMNTSKPPFNEPRVRQAFRLLANREDLVKRVLRGQGRIANDLYAPQDAVFNSSIPQRQYDLEQAKKLLAEAGYGNGLTVELVTLAGGGVPSTSALVLAEQAKQANVKIVIRQVDAATYAGPQRLNWALSTGSGTVGTPYLSSALSNDAPISTGNKTHFDNAEFSQLFFDGLAQPDIAKRRDLLGKAQEIQHREGGLLIWGFGNVLDGVSNKIGGAKPEHTQFVTWRFENLWRNA